MLQASTLDRIRRLLSCLAVAGPLLASCGGGGGSQTAPPPQLARLEVSPQRLSIAVGKHVSLTITGVDSEGRPMSPVASIESSDASRIAIVSNQLQAMGPGVVTLTVRSGDLETAVEAQVLPAEAGSDDLIAAALGDGRITADQALKYRVFAAYDDPALPLEFLGTRRPRRDPQLMLELVQRLPSLSDTDAAALQPFTVPPIYADSWYARQAATARKTSQAADRASAAGSIRPGDCTPHVLSSWRQVDTANFRIWYDGNTSRSVADAQTASILAGSIEAVRSRLVTQFGMRAPLTDDGLPCNGGDGRFDIYLVPPMYTSFGASGDETDWEDMVDKMGVTISPGVSSGGYPAFIQLNSDLVRTVGASGCSAANCYLMGTVAHEYFHAIQYAYPYDRREAYWLEDATADLAIDLFDPNNNFEQSMWKTFLDAQDTPLWFPNRPVTAKSTPLHRAHDHKRYGASVFFYVMAKLHGTAFLPEVFNGLAGGASSLVAVDRAIPGGLAKGWHDAAIKLYNRAPVTSDPASLKAWDNYTNSLSLDVTSPHPAPQVVDLGMEPAKVYTADVNLPMLSMQVVRFDLSNDLHTSSLAFFNGWSFQASQVNAGYSDETFTPPTTAVAGSMLYAAELSPEARRGRGLWAVIKTKDGAQRVEDWSDRPMGLLCRTDSGDAAQGRPDQRVEFLTLIFDAGYYDSGAPAGDTDPDSAKIDARRRKATDKPFTLVASRAPCSGYTGTATSEWTARSSSPQANLSSRVTLSGKFTPDLSALITERIDDATQRRLFYMSQLPHRFSEGTVKTSLTGSYCNVTMNEANVESPAEAVHSILVWPALLPGGAHVDAAASTTRRYTWVLPPCGGVVRETPEQRAFDFNTDLAEGRFTPFVNEFGTLNLANQVVTSSSPTFGTVNVTTNACFKRTVPGYPDTPACP